MQQQTARLAGKTALIFGGGQARSEEANPPMGNGRAVALRFAAEGARVMVADKSAEAAEAVVGEICAAGGVAEAAVCDVLEEAEIKAAIARTEQQFEAIDILHNNVGLSVAGGDKPVLEIEPEDFDFLFRLNLRAMVLAAKHALPGMRERRRGVIINISSVAASETYPWVGYKTSKAGILALTEQLAIQNAEFGIRAVTILPGLIDTVMAVDARARAWGRSREDVAAERAAKVPMGRQGRAEDVANAALFLASDEASFISGIHLRVDGAAGCKIG